MEAIHGGDHAAFEQITDQPTATPLVYWFHDKYRPKKPKYSIRVRTGYEWNRDNRPRKVVRGYKFNIFYPDLAVRTKAPRYTIEKDGSSEGNCIIRFEAQSPYQDIAFRIVDKEWEYSGKKGFKCTFESGTLRLYFDYVRDRHH